MSHYQCKRCFHITKQKIEMQRHLNRKVKCVRNLESYKYSDEQISELSLKIIKNNKNSYENDQDMNFQQDVPIHKENNISINYSYLGEKIIQPLDEFEEKNIYIKNQSHNSLIEETIDNKTIDNSSKKNLDMVLYQDLDDDSIRSECNHKLECIHCKKEFTRKSSLARHIKYRCKEKNNTNLEQNNITNITNNNNTIIINVNINKPLPFDEDWDVSKIDSTLKHLLLFSDLKYTKTLEAILENEVNLNVIIEDTEDCGIVYKNDIEKFTPMKIEDIIHLSMNKLHKHLQNFHEEVRNDNPYEINQKLLEAEKEMIDKKYVNFKNNAHTQKMVKNFISDIFNKKKEDTLRICNDLIDKSSGY